MILIKIFLSLFLFFPYVALAQEEYSFDLSEIEKEVEKKPYSVGGYFEFRPNLFWFDQDSAFYKLKFFNRPKRKTLDEYNFRLLLDASFQKGIANFFLRTNVDLLESDLESDVDKNILEGYMSLKPSPFFTVDLGQKALNWGKGYAWNPVGFVQRPKDPDDPDLPLEGFIVVSADYIKSFNEPLQTVTITPVLIPVYEDINDDFGEINHINFAVKMYLLLCDTDVDFMFLTGASKPFRVGMDFSRNVTTNFEIHGEFAYINNFKKIFVNSNGNLFHETFDAKSYLVGIRYLTSFDTTFICEYYRNGTGLTGSEMTGFFALVDKGYDVFLNSGDDTILTKTSFLAEKSYGRRNPMRDYLYLRISQKEPFDILYCTPSITGICNLNDQSYSLSPELLYTGIANLELRLKGGLLVGSRETEYNEKQNDYRVELRVRYYFDAIKLLN
ncbi:MAG: hypothetical protein SV375_01970 [Thermodesulfobacteriota bacterium]|nr:hypothetical protein [Thermodesulfobacteriota bacterium]